MKSPRRKKILIIGAILVIIVFFYYAFNVYQKYRIGKLPRMRVVLELDSQKYLQSLAKNKDETYQTIMEEINSELKSDTNQDFFGLLQKKFSQKQLPMNRYFGNVNDDNNNIIVHLRNMTTKAFVRDEEVVRNRLDQYGVSDPLIQKQNNWRLLVEIPVERYNKNTEEAIKQLLQGNALLEFRLVKDPEFTISVMQNIDKVLAGTDSSVASNKGEDTAAKDTTKQISAEEFKKQHPFFSIALLNPQSKTADAYVKDDERNKLTTVLNRQDVQKVIPSNVEFVYSSKPFTAQNGDKYYTLYLVNKIPELTGSVITDADASIDPTTSSPIVNMTMNAEGATQWARITGANVGKRIAIMLDSVVFSAPNVKGKIPSGRSQIEGMENMEEAKLLEIVLKAGVLAAPFIIISQEYIEAKK